MWSRLKGARIVQVLLVYLGASWVVLQITETVMGLLSLPAWVGPVSVLLLLVGLVVVLATAWVQSLPQTTAAEEAGKVPTDWQVAPADAVASLREGKLPHLTWGRAIVGGVVALSLLFGGAGLLVLIRGPGSVFGPAQAGASAAASGIAVLPFHVTGPELEVYREGMVDLVSANLDGLSDFRAIDARTVLARWNREIGETADAELDAALRVAAGTGARYAIVGSGVEVGGQVRFTAQVYDLSNGEKVGDGRVEGSPDNVLLLVDELTVAVMRSLLAKTGGGSTAQTFRLASILTSSVPALRSYLEGDAAFRRGLFREAQELLQEAIRQDSTFALAYWRLGESIGWADGINNPGVLQAKQKAVAYMDRLPAREAALLQIGLAVADGTIAKKMPELRSFLSRYPDDPDGWYMLGEAGLHSYSGTGVTDAEIEEALYRVVELDPTFGPYYDHAARWAIARNDTARFEAFMEGYAAAGADLERAEEWRLLWNLVRGDEEAHGRAAATLGTMTPAQIVSVDNSFLCCLDDELHRIEPLRAARSGNDLGRFGVLYLAEGRLSEFRAVRAANLAPGSRLQGVVDARAFYLAGATTVEPLEGACAELRSNDPGQRSQEYWGMALCAHAAGNSASFEAAAADARKSFEAEMANNPPPPEFDTTGWRGVVAAHFESLRLAAAGNPTEGYRVMATAAARVSADLGEQETMAELASEAGLWAEAIRLWEGISRSPGRRTLAKFRLGQVYEARGDTAAALAAYRTVLTRTVRADPDFLLDDLARDAVARLEGSRSP